MALELAKADTLTRERRAQIEQQFVKTPKERLESNREVDEAKARTRDYARALAECDLAQHPMARAIAEVVGNSVFRRTSLQATAESVEESFITAYAPRNVRVRLASNPSIKVLVNLGAYHQTLRIARAPEGTSSSFVKINRSYARPLQLTQVAASLGLPDGDQPMAHKPLFVRQIESAAISYEFDVDWETAQARFTALGSRVPAYWIRAARSANIPHQLPWHYAPVFNKLVELGHRSKMHLNVDHYPVDAIEVETKSTIQLATGGAAHMMHSMCEYRANDASYASCADAMLGDMADAEELVPDDDDGDDDIFLDTDL